MARGSSILNLPTAGAAAALFGIVGYPLAKYSSLGTVAMVTIAGAAAAAAAAGMVAVIAGWAVPSAALHAEDPRFALQGHPARVSQAISNGRPGEIFYEHDGAHRVVPAVGLEGASIAAGAEVVIERIEDGIAHVELVEQYRERAGKAQLSISLPLARGCRECHAPGGRAMSRGDACPMH